jgi:hypothetical protein
MAKFAEYPECELHLIGFLGSSLEPASDSEAFTRGFFSQEYAVKVRLLAVQWLLDDEEG